MADPSFCDIPIIVREDMPVGCMVVVSADGRQVIPIVNLDIEVSGSLPPGPPLIEYGRREVTGTFTANFVDEELYARFTSGMNTVGRYALEAIVKLGDQLAAKGQLGRHELKRWRKHRRKMIGQMRRDDARERRRVYSLPVF